MNDFSAAKNFFLVKDNHPELSPLSYLFMSDSFSSGTATCIVTLNC